ncbi:MAG TPA: sigma 54-interacting transcriptional regulator [Methylomirabilota bacterium]|nr:sigma 54-interacting transcriptional regulator [Methylomirabilota bacterium]
MDAESPRPAEPARDTERYRALLEINNAIISNLTRDGLFNAIARALRGVVPLDRTAIFLHDPRRNVLRLFVLESSLPSDYFVVGLEMGAGETHVGWAFQEQRSLLRRDLEKERQYAMEDHALADGVRSYVLVPLVARGRSVGVLAVASTRSNQYSDADVEFLQEVANQVALAVANMKAYEDITTLNLAMQQEVARRAQAEEVLRAITEGTAAVTGSDFFYSLVRHLAAALGVRYAFVTERRDGQRRLRTRAVWAGNGVAENFEYDVAMTPCQQVVEGATSYHCRNLQGLFPHDKVLVELGAESYLGIPLVDSAGQVIGLLTVLDDKPMTDPPAGLSILQVFASRAGAELERLKAEEALQAALTEVETLRNRLHAENVYLQEEIRGEHNFVEMIGSSPALLGVLQKIEQVARTDSTVLISGETGTGKELVARAVHDRSARRHRPLVKVDCSAISAGLVESELFGHAKGAFTGAIDRRVGRFELADGGTIFLDEIGELPPEAQVKLLRVLQEQEFEPVGSNRTVRVDVRVIAATNRDLGEAVRAGRFRADLFYRLNVFPIELPPLRDRRSDIPQLVTFFLGRFSIRFGKRLETVSGQSMERLLRYSWPGNIRELQNVIERAVILAPGTVLELDADPAPASSLGPAASPPSGSPEAAAPLPSLEEVERAHILTALKSTGGVVEGPRGAAQILKLHPNTLRSRMEKLGIKRPRHE